MKRQSPKFLIISHNSFSKSRNNGKTLEAIFSQVPINCISQLFFNNDEPDFDFCINYFRILDIDILRSLFFFKKKCGNFIETNSSLSSAFTIGTKFWIFKNIYSGISHFKILRDIIWKSGVWKSANLFAWIDSFCPDVIFFVGGDSCFSHDVALYISKRFSLPLISYFTDDYLIYAISRDPLSYLQKVRIKKYYKNTIAHSSMLYTISDLMSNEYSKYFNRRFNTIMNSVSVSSYVIPRNNDVIIFSYFGGLHLNRSRMICRLGYLLSNTNVLVHIYTSSSISKRMNLEFQKSGVIVKEPLFGTELQQALYNSDVLLHVESDDRFYRAITRLSISTKIPEYLLTGRLILAYGPSEVASMKLIQDNDIGIVISSALSDNEIREYLIRIISDRSLRNLYGEKAYSYGVLNCDNKKISESFLASVIYYLDNNAIPLSIGNFPKHRFDFFL